MENFIIIVMAIVIWQLLGSITFIWIGLGTKFGKPSEGLEFINPSYIYKHTRVNWLGLVCVLIAFFVISPVMCIMHWVYDLCTLRVRRVK